jgi:hypothetical protein
MLVLAACGAGGPSAGDRGRTTTSAPRPMTTTRTMARSPTTSNGTGAPIATGACANGIVTDALRVLLVQADGHPGGQAVPGATYYGTCGTTGYAVARFMAAPGATLDEQVSFQDDGSGPRFLLKNGGGAWTVVGTFPYDVAPSCATFTMLPTTLKTLWQDCPLG